jgi:hypothetical protein
MIKNEKIEPGLLNVHMIKIKWKREKKR